MWPVDREHKPIPIERNPTTIARCQMDDADHSESSRIDAIDLPIVITNLTMIETTLSI